MTCLPVWSERLRGDGGVAGVLVLVLAVVVASVGALLATLAAVGVARHRAAGVADLSALAAAHQALAGSAAACATAERTAVAGGATLLDCRMDGDEANVVVEVRPPGRLGDLGAVRGRARAGPAWEAVRP
jgi:secretion/DNA translocation related TadE-like protein